MKNRTTYFVYQFILILCQIGIVYGLDYQATECSGYGFYNVFAIQLFFTAEFIISTLIVSFQAEYFFENVGIVITLRYKSKQKIYAFIIIQIFAELILYKIIVKKEKRGKHAQSKKCPKTNPAYYQDILLL